MSEKAIAQPQSVFDQNHYLRHIDARGAFIRRLVPQLVEDLDATTALDAGCGLGFFAQILKDCGLSVHAFDGRVENVEEARRRYPAISFDQADLENPAILNMRPFDLVLCFGLLYHLENPLLAIRHLHSLTRKGLLVESMCLPDQKPWMLLRDEPNQADQSLTDLAFYATEGCLVKMLLRAGFARVFRVDQLPDHDDFRETPEHTRRRTVLFASNGPLNLPGLTPIEESPEISDPWAKMRAKAPTFTRKGKVLPRTFFERVRYFLAKPPNEKIASLAGRVKRRFPQTPVPVRLPFGAWWLSRDDHVGRPLREGWFEAAEAAFVGRFLQPGMNVLDIGAHHGLYTLLASERVGPGGRVVAFEPSPREKKALAMHVRLNRCKNVIVQGLALGSEETDTLLYVVEGVETGCNSLRPPNVVGNTSPIPVHVTRLDDWLQKCNLDRVDFIKLDVEGGELGVLKGAGRLLERRPRPVILAEVQDIRTQPWGYPARDIIQHLSNKGFRWFRLLEDGSVQELDLASEAFDGNFVAWPDELPTNIPVMGT